MPYENISAELTGASKDAAQALINELKVHLPFLINLTPDERKSLYKMGDKSVAFVDKALEYAQNNSNLVPPYLDIAELQKDMALYKQLTPIYQMIKQLAEGIEDTYIALGSEAMVAATAFYQTVKNAAKSNVPGTDTIYSDLRARFSGRPRTSPELPVN